jgi:hypothetical protein
VCFFFRLSEKKDCQAWVFDEADVAPTASFSAPKIPFVIDDGEKAACNGALFCGERFCAHWKHEVRVLCPAHWCFSVHAPAALEPFTKIFMRLFRTSQQSKKKPDLLQLLLYSAYPRYPARTPVCTIHPVLPQKIA